MAGQATVNTADEARITRASQAIRAMSDDLRTELDQTAPPPLLQRLRALTREAPLPALGIAFLLGVILTQR